MISSWPMSRFVLIIERKANLQQMNEKALQVLEYTKIIDRLTAMANSVPGKQLCRELLPLDDITLIRQMQTETTDALRRIYQKGSLSFAGVADIRPSLQRLSIGSSLSIQELLSVNSLLEAAKRVKSYSRNERAYTRKAEFDSEEDREDDSLDQRFRDLEPLSNLSAEISRCILSVDEVADDASPKLRSIRRNMSLAHEKIRSVMNGMITGSARTYLQDAVVTMRNGRFCLPVKSEHRNQVAGMIHDQSSSGSTVFIEPMAVVRLNNELRELELEEQKEIDVILATLSSQVAESSDLIVSDIAILTELDFIFARAMLSKSYAGYAPDFNTDGIINIRKGRHPLLDQKTVVPVDIRLGNEFDLLVISGPNTGGKTVSLKTTGLFTLMGQAGLHIPAAEHSMLSVFKEVFADIGDEQSIEQSLSTFSSHMKNIVSFWKEADEDSLVLFDELGAGTDPTEGAALAIAILSDLHRRGSKTIATTHYSELKIYALSTPGVENACCEFDVETLRPTYRLLIGIPGKSNAFAISERLGLPRYIIEEAKEHIGQEAENFEDVVAGLEDSRKQAQKELEEAIRNRTEAENYRKKLEQRQNKLDSSREQILAQAREEAHQILREAKEYADETIRRYNKMGGNVLSAKDMERERTRLREKMGDLETQIAGDRSRSSKKAAKPRQLKVGDSVRVLSMNLRGTVSTLPDANGNLFVQMGILRSQVNINDLELLEEASDLPAKGKVSGAGKIKMSKSSSVETQINLLGKTVDEALTELDKYLDDAYLAHLPSVRIVHGKGTGTLRNAVHKYLKRQRHVDSFRLGTLGEGDTGVTIVYFK